MRVIYLMYVQHEPESWTIIVLQARTKERRKTSTNRPGPRFQLLGVDSNRNYFGLFGVPGNSKACDFPRVGQASLLALQELLVQQVTAAGFFLGGPGYFYNTSQMLHVVLWYVHIDLKVLLWSPLLHYPATSSLWAEYVHS